MQGRGRYSASSGTLGHLPKYTSSSLVQSDEYIEEIKRHHFAAQQTLDLDHSEF